MSSDEEYFGVQNNIDRDIQKPTTLKPIELINIELTRLENDVVYILIDKNKPLQSLLREIATSHNPSVRRYLLFKVVNGAEIEIDLDEDEISLYELGLEMHPVVMKHRDYYPTLTLTDNPVVASIVSVWGSLLNDKTGDICFTFSKGAPIRAHSCILIARCKHIIKSSSKIIHISNVSRQAYFALLFYLYTDRIPDHPSMDEELYALADRYFIKELISKIEARIVHNMTPYTVVDILFNFGYKWQSLKEKCLHYIGVNHALVHQPISTNQIQTYHQIYLDICVAIVAHGWQIK